jgi:hypothetical protein
VHFAAEVATNAPKLNREFIKMMTELLAGWLVGRLHKS